MIKAVLFDFGGVVTTSPFEAFAAYEARVGLPVDFIRRVNSTDPDTNAWARLERSEVTMAEFSSEFARESAALGHEVDGSEVLGLLYGDVRPEMLVAVRRCAEHLRVACLTNNFGPTPQANGTDGADGADESANPAERPDVADAMALFDEVIESRVLGVRKPDPRFYELACAQVGIEPSEAVFLDDLGINLKTARAMGMTTIKVTDSQTALAELEQVVGFSLS